MTKYAGRDLVLGIASPALAATSVASTDLFTTATHSYAAGDTVVFRDLAGGAGLTEGQRYFVIAAGLTATVFAVSETLGGSSFDHTTNVTAGTVAAFRDVGQVTALGEAGSARDLIDASAYGDDWKDYVVGQQDGNELDMEVAYDPADTQHTAVRTAYAAGTPTTFSMIHADADFDVSFAALVTKLGRGADLGGLLGMKTTLKILNPGVVDN